MLENNGEYFLDSSIRIVNVFFTVLWMTPSIFKDEIGALVCHWVLLLDLLKDAITCDKLDYPFYQGSTCGNPMRKRGRPPCHQGTTCENPMRKRENDSWQWCMMLDPMEKEHLSFEVHLFLSHSNALLDYATSELRTLLHKDNFSGSHHCVHFGEFQYS